MRILFAALSLPLLATLCACGDGEPPPERPWITRPSGLAYKVLEEGRGEPAGPNDIVHVEYEGRFPDGRVFDTSKNLGRPFPVQMSQPRVIPGWIEALRLIPEGARWLVRVPPDLAYGVRGSPPKIPPNATLDFEMEAVRIDRVPTFEPLDEASAKSFPSGLSVQVVEAGTGEPVGHDAHVSLEWAAFTEGGRILGWHGGARPLQGLVKSLPVPFLREVVPSMREGGRLRVKVPPALGPKANPARGAPAPAVTIWELELTEARPAPR